MAAIMASGAAAGNDNLRFRVNGHAHETGLFFRQGLAEIGRTPGDGILMGALLSHLGQAVGKLPGRIKIRETLGEIHRAILLGYPGHAADY